MLLTTHAVRCSVPPSKPIILDEAMKNVRSIEERYNEGSDVNLICEVRGGKPPPKLTWYLDNTVIDESYHYNAETGITVNHLAYPKIGRQHLKARLICQASNTNLVPPLTRLLILDINRKLTILCILSFQFFYYPVKMRFKEGNCFVAFNVYLSSLSSSYTAQFRAALNIAFTHVVATA